MAFLNPRQSAQSWKFLLIRHAGLSISKNNLRSYEPWDIRQDSVVTLSTHSNAYVHTRPHSNPPPKKLCLELDLTHFSSIEQSKTAHP